MYKYLLFFFLPVLVASCGSVCDLGISCPAASKKKGDLYLKNKTDWKILSSIGIDGDPELVNYDNVQIPPDYGAEYNDVIIPEDGELWFMLTYQPPPDMPSTANEEVIYNVNMIPDTLTNVDLNGEKMYGDWLTPSGDNTTVTYPDLPTTPGGGTGGGDACAGASTGPCAGYSNQCSSCGSNGCQAPCYCAAACVCHYCGDSCEASNKSNAASLGTTCSY